MASYKIVSHGDAQATEDEVNTLLENGWELLGDLKVSENAYSQAMTKREYTGVIGIDSSVLVTIDELDGIKYAIESIGESLETVAKAVGYAASPPPAEPPKSLPATKPTKAKRKSSKK